ncbi:Hypothetical protein R9X50_00654100 [Acrodontium crateriforme]|uniref:Protein kinase domain-containing protein n=1 Tax=Acrodontium crateriforme TaxID=150365 RepID=A0AAQ3RDN6_9PEZI|nr:Hypothetical protein R9X50_00654100 [Acrodontium crateriforme]
MQDSLTPTDAEFLDPIIEFPSGERFERIQAITDFRRDDSLGEARILFLCRRVQGQVTGEVTGEANGKLETEDEEKFVLKVKVQVPSLQPNGIKTPLSGPRAQTQAEINALRLFVTTSQRNVPHLIATKTEPQTEKGLFPGGYVAYVVMTLMPGLNLMDLKFWSQSDQVKEEIRGAFIVLLKEIWRVGFAPYDCALRNILWEAETKTCSIVDFEHYEPAKDPVNMHITHEMQRWGVVQKPPAPSWHHAWMEGH